MVRGIHKQVKRLFSNELNSFCFKFRSINQMKKLATCCPKKIICGKRLSM